MTLDSVPVLRTVTKPVVMPITKTASNIGKVGLTRRFSNPVDKASWSKNYTAGYNLGLKITTLPATTREIQVFAKKQSKLITN